MNPEKPRYRYNWKTEHWDCLHSNGYWFGENNATVCDHCIKIKVRVRMIDLFPRYAIPHMIGKSRMSEYAYV